MTMPAGKVNMHEQYRREVKARKMASALHKHGIVSLEVPAFGATDHWAKIAKAADCKPPNSEETRNLVVEMVKEMEHDG